MKYWMVVVLVLLFGLGVCPAQAQNRNNSKAEVILQKWEYKFVFRTRDTVFISADNYVASDWQYIEDGQKNLGVIDIISKSKELGEAGWELVEIASRSSDPNHPGFTSEELWTFKRPKY